MDLSEVEKLFVTRVEVFSDGFRVVGGEGEEFLDLSPVNQVTRTDHLDTKGNREILRG